MRRTTAILAAASLSAGVAGCGGRTATSDPASASAASIAIHAFAFTPRETSVPVGSTVTWTNEDDIVHTVTSGVEGTQGVPGVSADSPPSPDGKVDRELAGVGSTATATFDEAGTFTYFCRIHPGMSGRITVV